MQLLCSMCSARLWGTEAKLHSRTLASRKKRKRMMDAKGRIRYPTHRLLGFGADYVDLITHVALKMLED